MEFLPYTTLSFNALPDLPEACHRFNSFTDPSIVNTEIRNLFIAHQMERTFGLSLAHRHFALNPNERLVSYGNTSVPWEMSLHPEVEFEDKDTPDIIKATAWHLTREGLLQPYEFEFDIMPGRNIDPTSEEQAKFVTALSKLLREKKIQGIFGLCKYPGDDFLGRLEITHGRANINLIPGDHPWAKIPQEDVAWFFSPELTQLGRCTCARVSGVHRGLHYGGND